MPVLATGHFRLLQCLKPSRPTRFPVVSMHRCFLIPEILQLILEFVHESPAEHECSAPNDSRQTLVSLAQTCRAFSTPALDLLWVRLDSLDPLIRVLPSRLWAKKHSRFVVRMCMNDKHWSTFRKYAVRVQFLRGPCRRIPPSVQRNIFAALARYQKASVPLLPNLRELVWSESDTFSVIDPTVSLIKFFAGSRVTSVSLFLVSWPIYVSARAVLIGLPDLFPNVTSFIAIPRATLSDHSKDIGDIVCKWSNLQVLHTCALSQSIMDELASRKTLHTLSVELNSYFLDLTVDKLPETVHTFSLEGSNALHCVRYLQTLHGNPANFSLHVGLDLTFHSDMDTLFQMLPIRFDASQMRDLTIGLKSSYSRALVQHSLSLTESLLASLYAFSSLVALDLDWFCTSGLDDAAYERMAAAWPELRSLKMGVADVSRARPTASVGAMIALLRSCLHLHTLHIVFDGSISPPPPMTRVHVEGGGTSCAPGWGVSNRCITQIHVGHSPVGGNTSSIEDLAACLKSVMPRLESIQTTKGPPTLLENFDVTEYGWRVIRHMVTCKT